MTRMTRCIRGCFVGGGLLGLVLVAGCEQQARRAAARNAATAAVAAATGQNSTTTTPAPRPRQRAPLIKPNGRGGYDSSAAQAAALKRAHYMSDKFGTINRTRQPTTRPATR